jgi:hypothetical protein
MGRTLFKDAKTGDFAAVESEFKQAAAPWQCEVLIFARPFDFK